MQSLDVISVNLWQIVISLANLTILFLLLKKFLYKPVKNVLAQRQAVLDEQYRAADEAKREALEDRRQWEEQLDTARVQADRILQDAGADAGRRGEKIVAEARMKADAIVSRAEAEAELTRKKAEADIRRDIVDVSTALTEKILQREVAVSDHQAMIDAFIGDMDRESGGSDA